MFHFHSSMRQDKFCNYYCQPYLDRSQKDMERDMLSPKDSMFRPDKLNCSKRWRLGSSILPDMESNQN